jgi:hypothetical protein
MLVKMVPKETGGDSPDVVLATRQVVDRRHVSDRAVKAHAVGVPTKAAMTRRASSESAKALTRIASDLSVLCHRSSLPLDCG